MSKITDIVGHPVGSNALKIELTLDNNSHFSHTLYADGNVSTNKAINVIKRIVKPHLSGMMLKHLPHLDKLIADVLDTAEGHTGGYNLSFGVSVLLWEAYINNQKTEEISSLLEQYSFPKSEKIPSYIFSLYKFGTQNEAGLFSEFMIIVRRNTEYTAAHKMYEKVYEKLSKVPAVANVDLIELIISKIKESNYLYNNDIFLGIKADLQKSSHTHLYKVPDILEDLDEVRLIEYFNKIVNTYDPLIIENSLHEYDSDFYEKLESSIGNNSLVGITANTKDVSDNALKRIIKNRRISICFLDTEKLNSITQLCELAQLCHESKVKFVITIYDHKNEMLREILTILNPEFIKYRIKTDDKTI